MAMAFLDFDIYSNRISFYSNNRERIGTYFGLMLTVIYLALSIVLIVIYSFDAVKRSDMRVYDSTVYSKDIPTININSKKINFAFGLENRISSNRFVDESIYYPEVIYFEREKVSGGGFKTVERKELNYSRCTMDHFGKDYMNILVENELNNSYCLDDFNLTLFGGYKYNKMSYIRIKINPCINGTKNNYNCKPKDIVDEYFSGTYFSILFKDIGLNPKNFAIPVMPTLQDLYTTIDKQIFRDFILNFQINEIHTDTGLFYEKIQKQKYLKFLNDEKSFYFRSPEEYNQGKQICAIQIRLNEIINIQSRSYKKLPESFSTIGGYMQILSTVFTLISTIYSKLDLEVKIMNDLFKFNLKENKMTIRIRTLKDFTSIKNKDYMKNAYRKSLFYHKLNQLNQNKKQNDALNNSVSKKKLISKKSYDNNSSQEIKGLNNNCTIIKGKTFDDNSKLKTKSLKNNIIYYRPFQISSTNSLNNKTINNNKSKIQINLIDYYCSGKICKKKEKVELFELGISLYRSRMDIINVFNILSLTEKIMLKAERQKMFNLNNDKDIETLPFHVLRYSKKQIEL